MIIPNGVANGIWPHGNQSILYKAWKFHRKPWKERDIHIYVNLDVKTNKNRRKQMDIICQKSELAADCSTHRLNYSEYLEELGNSKFVFSPNGSGPDCHRTWESIIMGAIPIIEVSPMVSLFDNDNVIIVKDYQKVTLDLLLDAERKMTHRVVENSKAFRRHWKPEIEKALEECKRQI
ncbi:hypothetical protein WR25_03585 isoform B [Diploscapter pachys]|nr:hypothetical protein WR25_03585 isoform B [Diploscapter pachys]